LAPVEHAEAFAAAVPHADLRVLERCGHYPQIELPSRVSDALDELLGAAGRSRAR
jgi:pimeloyl-ACP methyl ester carboxylesterase